jgi:hypothetical protein
MEKLLLTVRKAPDVLSVSQSRVYELLYAEQLDSVNSFGAAFGGQSVGVMNSRRPQGEGPDGPASCGPTNRTTRPASR